MLTSGSRQSASSTLGAGGRSGARFIHSRPASFLLVSCISRLAAFLLAGSSPAIKRVSSRNVSWYQSYEMSMNRRFEKCTWVVRWHIATVTAILLALPFLMLWLSFMFAFVFLRTMLPMLRRLLLFAFFMFALIILQTMLPFLRRLLLLAFLLIFLHNHIIQN